MNTSLPTMTKTQTAKYIALLALVSISLSLARAQAVAAAVGPTPGFQLPTVSGTLHYGLSLSERAVFGYEGNDSTYYSTNFSGNLGYLSESRVHPFSAIYSGGYLLGTNGQQSSQYHDLAFSQVATFGRWTAVVGDSIAYLPESAAGGLSGIPGLGDANLTPGQPGTFLDQSILNRNVTRISNIANGSLARQLTGATGIFAGGSFGVDRYIGAGGTGIDDNNASVSAGLNHRIDARTTTGAVYSYSRYSYTGQNIVTSTQTASLQASHQFSRKLSASGSAGPQWINSNTPLIPSQLSYALSGNFSYAAKNTSSSVGFSRGTNAGSGVITGAISNSLFAGLQHRFGTSWQGAANVFYVRSHSLATGPFNVSFDEVVGTLQVNRAISRSVSAYASYSAERQIDNGPVASVILFNGLSQTLGFGITFSPESIHVGRR